MKENIESQLVEIIKCIEKYKNSFFWKNTGNAASRRKQEFSAEYNMNIFDLDIKVELALRISCKNFYFTKNIIVNGKKSNVLKLKNILKKIREKNKISNNRVQSACTTS